MLSRPKKDNDDEKSEKGHKSGDATRPSGSAGRTENERKQAKREKKRKAKRDRLMEKLKAMGSDPSNLAADEKPVEPRHSSMPLVSDYVLNQQQDMQIQTELFGNVQQLSQEDQEEQQRKQQQQVLQDSSDLTFNIRLEQNDDYTKTEVQPKRSEGAKRNRRPRRRSMPLVGDFLFQSLSATDSGQMKSQRAKSPPVDRTRGSSWGNRKDKLFGKFGAVRKAMDDISSSSVADPSLQFSNDALRNKASFVIPLKGVQEQKPKPKRRARRRSMPLMSTSSSLLDEQTSVEDEQEQQRKDEMAARSDESSSRMASRMESVLQKWQSLLPSYGIKSKFVLAFDGAYIEEHTKGLRRIPENDSRGVAEDKTTRVQQEVVDKWAGMAKLHKPARRSSMSSMPTMSAFRRESLRQFGHEGGLLSNTDADRPKDGRFSWGRKSSVDKSADLNLAPRADDEEESKHVRPVVRQPWPGDMSDDSSIHVDEICDDAMNSGQTAHPSKSLSPPMETENVIISGMTIAEAEKVAPPQSPARDDLADELAQIEMSVSNLNCPIPDKGNRQQIY